MYPRSELGAELTDDIPILRGVDWKGNDVPDDIRNQIAARYDMLRTEAPAELLRKCKYRDVKVCDVTVFLCDMLHTSPPPSSSNRQVLFTTCMPLVNRPKEFHDLQFHALQMLIASRRDVKRDDRETVELLKNWDGYDLGDHFN